jgi:pimeloyl-ACP methyl ester carboxylesterase
MERLPVKGAELEYETRGDGEPLVLIHGSIVGDGFAPLLGESALTSRFRVTNYHRRGFNGSSRHDGPFSIEQQAADALAVIEQVAGGRAHVAGHSYGAVTALQLALDNPQSVHSLALLEPPLAVPSAEAFFAEVPAIAALYQSGDNAGAVAAFLGLVFGPSDWRPAADAALGAGWFEQAVADIDTFFQVELPALANWQLPAEKARQISQPVLAVVGANSSEFFREGYELLRRWFPQAEGFVLPGTTHTLQVQDPDGMATALAAFLTKHPMREAAIA